MNIKNILQVIFCLVWLVLPLAGHASPVIQPDPQAVGAWSPIVNGVQGRLLVAVDGKVNGTRQSRIYLEFRNVSDGMTPLRVAWGSGAGLKLEVVDGKNKRIADTGGDFDAMSPDFYEVVLPQDSSLRFLVSVSGYGVPKDAGTMLELGVSDGLIILPSQSRETYFLLGSFSVPASTKLGSQQEWHGTLTLPKVKVPL